MTGASERLGAETTTLLRNPATDVYFSVVSAWELAIKAQLGKLDGVGDIATFVRSRLALQQITVVEIGLDVALAVDSLPLHHRDPFDRLLIAQAMALAIPIVTSDKAFEAYPVVVLDALR